MLAATGIAGVLASVALPSFTGSLAKARRTDAIVALLRLESAQARFRGQNGLYTDNLAVLGAAGRSAEGHYRVWVEATGASGYRAIAEAVDGSPQQADGACSRLTLQVDGERVRRGPSPACWNR